MSAFKKIWVDAWSARMEYILSNTILALLEYPESTMLDINRMYTDKQFRDKVVDYVKDPLVKAFWTQEFAGYTDRYAQEATPAIQNKIGQFTANPIIRNIIGQPHSSFDLRTMMDEKKIVIINLSKGRVGESNANLLGSMLITKIYLAAMSRADVSEESMRTLPNFYLYVDEFQSFANESFANILSEARKYKLNLTIAHQYIEQMSEEVRAAVFGNVGTMAAFRVGAYDAEVLEKEFAPAFTAEDMVNLGFAQIYLKLMIDGISSAPFSATTLPPIEPGRISYRDVALARSREQFAEPRSEVEARINAINEEAKKSGEENGKDKKDKKERSGKNGGQPPRGRGDFAEKQKPREKQSGKKEKEGNTLRDALAAALNDRGSEEEKTESDESNNLNDTPSRESSQNPSDAKRDEERDAFKKEIQEIPKDRLKKMLYVEKKPDNNKEDVRQENP